MMSIVGLDIGGANLKAVHTNRTVRVRPFELWKQPESLANALQQQMCTMPAFDLLAVTMTGELCDCYATKRQGVTAILEAVKLAATGRPIRVWCNDGCFRELAEARQRPLQVAAANWLALATFAGRFAPDGPGLLVDIGSTTTDLVPLGDGLPLPRGRTDPERLRACELVYTGVRRTPVCALLNGLGAAEWFATTHDVNLVLGLMPEDTADRRTADGRPATRSAARARLARMLCADEDTCTPEEIDRLAEQVLCSQELLLVSALRQVCTRLGEPIQTVVLAGSGEFLARRVLERYGTRPGARIVSLTEHLGAELSEAACAHAVAILAAEQAHG